MMSLCVLVILASPFTWRRTLLVALMIAGFVLLFPVESIREFYDLQVPGDVLAETLVIGFVGVAILGGGWELSRRMGWGPAAAVKAGTAVNAHGGEGAGDRYNQSRRLNQVYRKIVRASIKPSANG